MKHKKVSMLVILVFLILPMIGCNRVPTVPETEPYTPTETTEPTMPPETTEPVATEPKFELPRSLKSVPDSELELDYKNHHIMALGKVEAKAIPVDAADTLYELNYELVKILAAVYGDDEIWALVRYASTMDGGGNMGWVKVSGLTEYTEENKALLRYPVTVKEGCKDAETGKELMPWEYALGAHTGEYVEIGNEAGSFLVKPEDIIYPSTVKTTDGIWGAWEE